MAAKEVIILITGHSKAYALYKCVEEGVNHMWTVSAIQNHPKAMVVCDDEATQELKVKTVNYFKGLMSTATNFGVGDATDDVRRASVARRAAGKEGEAPPVLPPVLTMPVVTTTLGAQDERIAKLEAQVKALMAKLG